MASKFPLILCSPGLCNVSYKTLSFNQREKPFVLIYTCVTHTHNVFSLMLCCVVCIRCSILIYTYVTHTHKVLSWVLCGGYRVKQFKLYVCHTYSQGNLLGVNVYQVLYFYLYLCCTYSHGALLGVVWCVSGAEVVVDVLQGKSTTKINVNRCHFNKSCLLTNKIPF